MPTVSVRTLDSIIIIESANCLSLWCADYNKVTAQYRKVEKKT